MRELTLFVDPRRLPDGFHEHVGEGVRALAETDASSALASTRIAGCWQMKRMRVPGSSWNWFAPGQYLSREKIPRSFPRRARIRLNSRVPAAPTVGMRWRKCVSWPGWTPRWRTGRLHDEALLSDKLLSLRQQGEHFHAVSFNTISAAGANAAMCHYNHLNGTPARLAMDSVYLLDSGGQYTDGTTDITRTVAIGDPGPEARRLFTLVLKGHIALAQARFPRGTTGTQLDALARQFLWREGFDYDHGTGHGVGVFLSVHEGPQRISKAHNGVALRPGMIVSNEPGYYRDGAFGMRCENLQVVRAC